MPLDSFIIFILAEEEEKSYIYFLHFFFIIHIQYTLEVCQYMDANDWKKRICIIIRIEFSCIFIYLFQGAFGFVLYGMRNKYTSNIHISIWYNMFFPSFCVCVCVLYATWRSIFYYFFFLQINLNLIQIVCLCVCVCFRGFHFVFHFHCVTTVDSCVTHGTFLLLPKLLIKNMQMFLTRKCKEQMIDRFCGVLKVNLNKKEKK